MVEAANTSETLVNFYQTTRRYNPEDSHLRSHRRENLKSNLSLGNLTTLFQLQWLYCIVLNNVDDDGEL
jgi:hypothetical protein